MTKTPRKPSSKPTLRRRTGALLLWTGIFLLLVAAIDQALLRFSPARPLLIELQACYQDLRGRLLHPSVQPDPIGVLLEPAKPSPRSFFYADRQGELHFVDSLQQVPAQYRREAQPLVE